MLWENNQGICIYVIFKICLYVRQYLILKFNFCINNYHTKKKIAYKRILKMIYNFYLLHFGMCTFYQYKHYLSKFYLTPGENFYMVIML